MSGECFCRQLQLKKKDGKGGCGQAEEKYICLFTQSSNSFYGINYSLEIGCHPLFKCSEGLDCWLAGRVLIWMAEDVKAGQWEIVGYVYIQACFCVCRCVVGNYLDVKLFLIHVCAYTYACICE